MNVALYNYTGVQGLGMALANSNLKSNNFLYISPTLLSREDLNSRETLNISMPGLEERDFIYGRQLDHILPQHISEQFKIIFDSLDQPRLLPSSDLQMCLRMAQRTRLHCLSYSEILFYVERITHFWEALLIFLKIDIFISSVVPHSFTDYLLACVSTQNKIPFLSQLPGGMSSHAFIYCHLQDRYIANSMFAPDAKDSKAALKDLRSLLLATSDPIKSAIPHAGEKAVRAAKSYSEYKRLLLNYQPHTFSPLTYLHFLAQQYDQLSIDPRTMSFGENNKSQFHVYFMHYQPEATTMPMAKQFACQKHTISHIRSQLKPSDILLIKEHPQQFKRSTFAFSSEEHLKAFHGFRHVDDYRFIDGLDNIYLINRALTIFDLTYLDPSVWISYGSISLQSVLLGLKPRFLETMNPYRILGRGPEIYTLTKIEDRINAICEALVSYLFPISRSDHDTLVDTQTCVRHLKNILDSFESRCLF